MNQLWSLRGHLNAISSIAEHKGQPQLAKDANTLSLITTDVNGWIIMWSVPLRSAKYVWKGHDKSILTSFVIDNKYLMTHSKDSEIKIWDLCPLGLEKNQVSNRLPNIAFNDTSYLKDDCSELLEHYPLPSSNSFPVNSLNFCKIDWHDGTLLTPATVNSNNFDIYQINLETFDISRLAQDVDGESLYKKARNQIDDIEKEIDTTKRDGFGIIMVFKFVDHNTFYVGYESGHLLGFKITYPTSRSIITNNSHSLISKDGSVALHYYNDFHAPHPVLSIEIGSIEAEVKLMAGSTSKYISVHAIRDERILEDDVEKINVKNGGIQSIQMAANRLLVGFWNGVVKVFDPQFQMLSKYQVALPLLQNITDLTPNTKAIETNLKLSVLKKIDLLPALKSRSKYKALAKIRPKQLVLAGYDDGKLMAFQVE